MFQVEFSFQGNFRFPCFSSFDLTGISYLTYWAIPSGRALFASQTKPTSCLGPSGNDPYRNTKGFALVIPLLPPRAQERGRKSASHTPERRLFCFVQGQGAFAAYP